MTVHVIYFIWICSKPLIKFYMTGHSLKLEASEMQIKTQKG